MVSFEAAINGNTETGGRSIFSTRSTKNTRRSTGSSVQTITRRSISVQTLFNAAKKSGRKSLSSETDMKKKKTRRSSMEKVKKIFGIRPKKGSKYQTLCQAPSNETDALSEEPDSPTFLAATITDPASFQCHSSSMIGKTLDLHGNDSDISVMESSVGGVSSQDGEVVDISAMQGMFGDDEQSETSEQFFKPVYVYDSDIPSSPESIYDQGQTVVGGGSIEDFDADGSNGESDDEVAVGTGFEETFMEFFEDDVDKSPIDVNMPGDLSSADLSSSKDIIQRGNDASAVFISTGPEEVAKEDTIETVANLDDSCRGQSLLDGVSPCPLVLDNVVDPPVAVIAQESSFPECGSILEEVDALLEESVTLLEGNDVSFAKSEDLFEDTLEERDDDDEKSNVTEELQVYPLEEYDELNEKMIVAEELQVHTPTYSEGIIPKSGEDLFTPLSQLQVHFKSAIILDETPVCKVAIEPMERSIASKEAKQSSAGVAAIYVLTMFVAYVTVYFSEALESIHARMQRDFRYTRLLSLASEVVQDDRIGSFLMSPFKGRPQNNEVDESSSLVDVQALLASNDFCPIQFPESMKTPVKKQLEIVLPSEKKESLDDMMHWFIF